jgi:hypothetical protein
MEAFIIAANDDPSVFFPKGTWMNDPPQDPADAMYSSITSVANSHGGSTIKFTKDRRVFHLDC